MGSTTTRQRLFFDKKEVADFPALLGEFGPGALASPYRSTVPLLSLVKDAPTVFHHVVRACGCSEPYSIHFEYQVTVLGVQGNPSQTDAMVVSQTDAVAMEAKWTEPRYETVATRLKSRIAKLTRDNPQRAEKHAAAQRAVIGGWLGLLSRRCPAPIELDRASEAIYQMVHRAASACHMSGASTMVYMHFEPSPAKGAALHSMYKADLAHLQGLLGWPQDFPFYLVSVPLELTKGFEAIQDLPKRSLTTDRAIREAILATRLFDFGDPCIERIRV